MRVAVMAAGAVGDYFGGRMAAAGHDVAFMARGAHGDAIRRGRLDWHPDAALAGYVEQMRAAGIDITMSDHMLLEIWKKFVVLSGTSASLSYSLRFRRNVFQGPVRSSK